MKDLLFVLFFSVVFAVAFFAVGYVAAQHGFLFVPPVS